MVTYAGLAPTALSMPYNNQCFHEVNIGIKNKDDSGESSLQQCGHVKRNGTPLPTSFFLHCLRSSHSPINTNGNPAPSLPSLPTPHQHYCSLIIYLKSVVIAILLL